MTDKAAATILSFTFDGQQIHARSDETLWQIAKRLGDTLPHLCFSEQHDYRADGNCRACLVEIEGERTLAPSCRRYPQAGMVVRRHSERAQTARRLVVELLAADTEPNRNRQSHYRHTLTRVGLKHSRFPKAPVELAAHQVDNGHPAIAFHGDACIQCNLCQRACREIQGNDVIGMGYRGHATQVIFDQDDPLHDSTCVACGECVQVCPTGALMPATLLDEQGQGQKQTTSETHSVCPFCGVGCQISIQVENQQIRYVEGVDGPANHSRLCVKGRFGFDYIRHPDRLMRPLIRKDPATKGEAIDPRDPSSHFREASWDEALQYAADGLLALKARAGGTSVAGFGSAKCMNEEAYLVQKLIRQGFGHNNVDHCTRLCHASSVAAMMEAIGSGAVTASFNQILNADVALVIGCNPTENHPVAATFFKQFVQRGGQLIVVDPRGIALQHVATLMLQNQPGSDVALLNAMMHVIEKNQWYDASYLQARTQGWPELQTHLQYFSPQKMTAICGLSVAQIEQAAAMFAKAKAGMIFWGMGITQHVHGTNNVRCLISLALMCGFMGKPGTGLHPLRGQNNVQGSSDAGLMPMYLPDYANVTDAAVRARVDAIWAASRGDGGHKLNDKAGLTSVEIMDEVAQGKIRGLYILGENPAMSDPNVALVRQGLAGLTHLVVQDLFLTETAQYADVVLPAAAFAEKTGTLTNTNRQVQLARAALPPPQQTKADWWIVTELAKRLGLNWDYQSEPAIYQEMQQLMPSLQHIDWARLEAESSVTSPCDGDDQAGHDVVFSQRFPTENGKATLVPASLVAPNELPDQQYPLVLLTGRQLEHWHTGSMTRRATVLDQLEPQAYCALHPTLLQQHQLQAGDKIRLVSRRGEIELRARTDPTMMPNSVFVPFCYAEAAANLLTNATLDPEGKIPELKFAAVRIETLL